MSHFNSKWTIDSLRDAASRFTTKGAFQKGNKGAYLAAYRRGILNDITSHMQSSRTTWTEESATKMALQFTSLTEFHDKASGAYNYLKQNNINVKELIKPIDKRVWNKGTISKVAKECTSRAMFKRVNISAYHAALSLGIIEDVCYHMSKPQKKHTYEYLEAEALKYTTKTEFKKGSYGAYQAACRRGIIDDIGGHMVPDIHSFQPMKPAILYYFKIDNVWKIGVTNYTLKDRYYKRDRARMSNIIEWEFKLGAEALSHEQSILKMYSAYKYTGPTPFTDGTSTTECFTCDIYNLEGEAIE